MWKTRKTTAIFAVLGFLLLVTCGQDKRIDLPRASIIVGNVECVRNGNVISLVKDQYLRAGDMIRVKENSKIKLELQNGVFWYLGNRSEMHVGQPVAAAGNKRWLPVRLARGQMHIVNRSDSSLEYSVTTAAWIIRVKAADITIRADSLPNLCSVSLLCGFAAFALPGGHETILPECCRLMTSENGPGELQPVTIEEIAALKSWVGSSIIEEALARSGCFVSEHAGMASGVSVADVTNMTPPEWRSLPGETAVLGESVADTILAIDPEQDTVTYMLVNGPSGMKVDRLSGVLSYKADTAGKYTVVLAAADRRGNACTTTVTMEVTGGLMVNLISPGKIGPDVPFTVSARMGKQSRTLKPEYRFDLNGDGIYEIPGNGKYSRSSSVKNYVINKEGVYRMRVEVRSEDGQTASASRMITVNAPPVAVLKITPQRTVPDTPVQFDISESGDKRNGTTPLRVRYDVDGDGIWDIPARGAGLTVSTSIHRYREAGVYTVIAQVIDKDGASSTVSEKVEIMRALTGGNIEGPDTVNVNDSVVLKFRAADSACKIQEYAWDFMGTGKFGQSGKLVAISTSYRSAGTFTAACRITDDRNQQTAVTKQIVVVNNVATIDAGGPYKTGVNKEIVIKGTAIDKDNRIILYSWDADGDGVADMTSKTDAAIRHIYKKAGKYTAVFTISTDDGKKYADSAQVDVENRIPAANAGEDVVSRKNGKVTLNGVGIDEDGKIALYEWDFGGDGSFDWSSAENGTVTHVFDSYTSAIFRVKDSDGATSQDTVLIIICPEGMQTIREGKFCIDQYEFPNRKNTLPQTDVTYEEAASACGKIGKRLCTTSEWEMACMNSEKNNNYPYGRKYDVDKCNTLGNPHIKNSIAVAGEFIECKNDAQIFDMSGNAAEWTAVSSGNTFVYGGSWQNGEDGSSCTSRVKLQKSKKYFYAGFRCCK